MKQRIVGRSGLRVSTIGLGTATWGTTTSLADATTILETFIDHGGNLIDVSPEYNSNRALTMLSEATKRVPREELILSSASGIIPGKPLGQRVDCSRRNLLAQLDATLKTLHTDYLDIWSAEFFDPHTPAEEVAATLDYALDTGRVRYAGVRNFSGWQLAVIQATGHHHLVAAQHEYNLLVRRPEEELLPATQYLQTGFFAAAPLARGVLTGRYGVATVATDTDDRTAAEEPRSAPSHRLPADSRGAHNAEIHGYFSPRTDAITQALNTAAQGLGISPTTAAISWVNSRPGVSSTIVTPRIPAHLEDIFAAEFVHLPKAITDAFDDISR